MSATKDPDKVRAGRIGARNRWATHEARVIKLDSLDGPARRLVLALVSAARAEAERNPEVPT